MLPLAFIQFAAVIALSAFAGSISMQHDNYVDCSTSRRRRAKRMHLTLVTRIVDVLLLAIMAYVPPQAGHLLVCIHLLRTAFANSSRPLLRSVLMDNGV